MTNKEAIDGSDESYDQRLAVLLAVRLVGQVLDEANIIVNAARESGQPWRYLMIMKNVRNDKTFKISNEEVSYSTSKGDNITFVKSKRDDAEEMNDEANTLSNVVVTSTPQKKSDAEGIDVNETNLIGQGDEEYEKPRNDETNYTSAYINHLFDMSEVEKVLFCDENVSACCDNIPPTCLEANTSFLQDIVKIIESYVDVAVSKALISETPENDTQIARNASWSTDRSCYSFLSDAFMADLAKDGAFFIDDGECNVRETSVEQTKEGGTIKDLKINEIETSERINAALYENVYLTLNRDYEQCSEDGGPVLQDPKGLSLHEVELMTTQTSDDNLSEVGKHPENAKESTAISVSASGSRKGSLVHRCRTQGARLLSCLRGWWKRKTPGKRKEFRVSGSIRGLCPLSPEARRRAASMLDQRHLCSPSPSRSIVWKFNTLNEALVNSSRWKEYAFDIRPNECNEN